MGPFLTQDPIGLAGGVNLYAYAGSNPVAFSDPFGLKIIPMGDKMKATIAILMQSATFRQIYNSLDREPSKKVEYTLMETTPDVVLMASAGSNSEGYTLVAPLKLPKGTSWVSNLVLNEEHVVHELVHAAGAYAGKGFSTGVPMLCETGHHDECWAIIARILDEVKAAKAKAKDAKKDSGGEP